MQQKKIVQITKLSESSKILNCALLVSLLGSLIIVFCLLDMGRGQLSATAVFCHLFGLFTSVVLAVLAKSLLLKQKQEKDIKQLALATMDNSRTSLSGIRTENIPEADPSAGLCEILQNMTIAMSELRRRESAIIEKAADVICIIDTKSRFISASRASLRDWGYRPEELAGLPITDLIETSKSTQVIDSILQTEKSIDKIEFECRLKKKTGELIDVLWTGYWSASDQGLFCIVHDISERKRVEKLKQEFMAMISHDIRTPLTSMLWLINSLQDGSLGSLNAEGQVICNRVQTECKRVVGLITDLLDLEKFESGKFVLDCNYVYIALIAKRACESIKPLALSKGISFQISEPELSCYADEERVLQVFLNLLSNSIKFSPLKASIELRFEESGDFVKTSVIDHGRGIPKEKLEAIFDRFEQVKTSDASGGAGAGLGLSICKSIVQEHGGEIGVEAVESGGACFWFTLPKENKTETEDLCDLP